MRQFGHLVQEDRTAVSLLEIPLAGLHGAGKGAFLVAEQFGVDRTLGNRRAVDGDVFAVLARGIGVDNLRKKLLAHTALARNEHRQVGRSHTQATSSALSRSGELPMMPKRCFTVVISVIYSGCSGWDAADGSSAACGSSMYSFSACFSRASRQSPKAMAATASRAAITAIQMNRSARRRGTRST